MFSDKILYHAKIHDYIVFNDAPNRLNRHRLFWVSVLYIFYATPFVAATYPAVPVLIFWSIDQAANDALIWPVLAMGIISFCSLVPIMIRRIFIPDNLRQREEQLLSELKGKSEGNALDLVYRSANVHEKSLIDTLLFNLLCGFALISIYFHEGIELLDLYIAISGAMAYSIFSLFSFGFLDLFAEDEFKRFTIFNNYELFFLNIIAVFAIGKELVKKFILNFRTITPIRDIPSGAVRSLISFFPYQYRYIRVYDCGPPAEADYLSKASVSFDEFIAANALKRDDRQFGLRKWLLNRLTRRVDSKRASVEVSRPVQGE